jgi:hypothetical protein
MAAEEEADGGYLKSLSNAETLAVFLNLRGQCLLTAGRKQEAFYAHAQALKVAPQLRSCQLVFETATREIVESSHTRVSPLPSGQGASRPPTLAIEPNPLNQILEHHEN